MLFRSPITETLQDSFFGLFTGKTDDKWGWLDHVDMAAPPRAAPAGGSLAPAGDSLAGRSVAAG